MEGRPQLTQMVRGVVEHHGFLSFFVLSFLACDFHPHDCDMVAYTLGRKKREEERRENASIRKTEAFLRNPPWTFTYVSLAKTGSHDC